MNRQPPKEFKSTRGDLVGSNSVPSKKSTTKGGFVAEDDIKTGAAASSLPQPPSLLQASLQQISSANLAHNASCDTLMNSRTSNNGSSQELETEQQYRQRLALTEQYLSKALQLDNFSPR